LTIPQGQLFGLLGSNGAGKTTTIRMILRILQADGGEVSWAGRPVTDELVRTFGYLPEERGLYPKMKVTEQLAYFGQLHGLTAADAKAATRRWIEKLELQPYMNLRLDQLSKGNQQKVQFAAAVLHNPALVILDEPFSGLDPVNAQVLREAMLEMHQQGSTVIFSSHRLDQVEQLCQGVGLIHHAQLMLSGDLRTVKRSYGLSAARLVTDGEFGFLTRFPQVKAHPKGNGEVALNFPIDWDPQPLLQAAIAAGPVYHWSIGEPSLEEIYLATVRGKEVPA
ncbi:MAG TPA: ATP-binding cassette domain-containing protein, partial [Symbiobacteriaceae bacterium]|nr:ATP-binding cassette domain-containing protein [Symbiobacteriaceae bacterium]